MGSSTELSTCIEKREKKLNIEQIKRKGELGTESKRRKKKTKTTTKARKSKNKTKNAREVSEYLLSLADETRLSPVLRSDQC